MVTGTLSLVGIVEAQARHWFVFTPWGLAGFLIFFLSGVAEVNRTPFDMPEAESELVAGFHTEYSGMKFALWYMAEFLAAFAVCAFSTTLFLGGWQGPPIPLWPFLLVGALTIAGAHALPMPLRSLGAVALVAAAVRFTGELVPSWAWFFGKTYLLVFVLVWFRGTFPRLRVDQLMGFAWKFLLPLALINMFAAAAWVALPGLLGWAASAAIVAFSYWALIRLNAPAPLGRRTYLLVE
jgi:NADH-quinone oxidoreductase subunit H